MLGQEEQTNFSYFQNNATLLEYERKNCFEASSCARNSYLRIIETGGKGYDDKRSYGDRCLLNTLLGIHTRGSYSWAMKYQQRHGREFWWPKNSTSKGGR